MEKLTGTVEEIIYQNEENWYTVCDIDANGVLSTAVGYMPFISVGETIDVEGQYKEHPLYGKQLAVSVFSKQPPKTEKSILKYLSSGFIKGVGPSTAQKIVDQYGPDSLSIIETNPQLLAEISGISVKKALMIGESYALQYGMKNLVMFLQQYNISAVYAAKIFARFGAHSVDRIRQNPYVLSREIYGIGFKTADKIAMKIGILHDDINRLKSGILYILSESCSLGHAYLPRYLLLQKSCQLLETEADSIENALHALAFEKGVVLSTQQELDCVYLTSYYNAERGCAIRLKSLTSMPPTAPPSNMDAIIKTIEHKNEITLDEKQRDALIAALTHSVLVITGGPGTGKTTVINSIIELMDQLSLKVVLAAPTGRASKRMTETTKKEAKTIHRLLGTEFSPDEKINNFSRNEENPIEADVIIIDEMSMVDILLFNSLLRAIPVGKKLILVGDADQLPSVGPGNVLRDIIKSESVAVIRLTEIFRQARESMIVVNAHRINTGQYPILNQKDKDFFFIPEQNSETLVQTLVELCLTRLPKSYGFDPFADIQVLTPMRKSAVGVNILNKLLQEALNPPSPEKAEKQIGDILFREGDKVMQVKNNYDMLWKKEGFDEEEGAGLFNGDLGIIEVIDLDRDEFIILFDSEKRVHYDFGSAIEIEMAYASTIHKSQGSEFPVVIMPVFQGPPMLQNRNLLYTAVTRAKKLVVLVGSENVLRQMISNKNEATRYCGLVEKLRFD